MLRCTRLPDGTVQFSWYYSVYLYVLDEPLDPSVGPSVEAALSMSPTQALMQAEPRKATIGSRKAGAAKKGVCISIKHFA